jgi:hypothetical protein
MCQIRTEKVVYVPRKKRKSDRVRTSDHAAMRCPERAGKNARKMEVIMTAALREQLRVGIPVKGGCPMLNLDGERLGLDNDLVAPLELPESDGVWKAITIRPNRWRSNP